MIYIVRSFELPLDVYTKLAFNLKQHRTARRVRREKILGSHSLEIDLKSSFEEGYDENYPGIDVKYNHIFTITIIN